MARRQPAKPARTARRIISPSRAEPIGLGMGFTCLNLGCTGKPTVGLLTGHYYLMVGDSQAGKSWLAQQILAEAANNPRFDGYDLIYEDTEHGVLVDAERYFGKKFVQRVQRPEPEPTLERWYDRMDDQVRTGRPFIRILDSEDALYSEAAAKKIQKNKTKRRNEDEDIKGSYGDGKAAIHSQRLRMVHAGVVRTNSILIIVKQSRDNIGPGAMFNPKTRSGGRALTFYAACEFWFSVAGKIKGRANGKDYVVGHDLKIQIKKNRISGLDRTVFIPHHIDHGLDDIGACVDYLVDQGRWPIRDGIITAEDLDFVGKREKLIDQIEADNREKELRALVTEVWDDVERQLATNRKRRYV